jgi:hypothetical protein
MAGRGGRGAAADATPWTRVTAAIALQTEPDALSDNLSTPWFGLLALARIEPRTCSPSAGEV